MFPEEGGIERKRGRIHTELFRLPPIKMKEMVHMWKSQKEKKKKEKKSPGPRLPPARVSVIFRRQETRSAEAAVNLCSCWVTQRFRDCSSKSFPGGLHRK